MSSSDSAPIYIKFPAKIYIWAGKCASAGWGGDRVIRLFKKSALHRYEGQLHEQPVYSGELRTMNHELIHYSHRDLTSMLNKTLDFTAYEAKLRLAAGHPSLAWWRFLRGDVHGILVAFCQTIRLAGMVWKALLMACFKCLILSLFMPVFGKCSQPKMRNNGKVKPNTACKIGIIGAKEVGKTGLANLLNGYLKIIGAHCDLVPETARNSPFLLNEGSGIGTLYWVLGNSNCCRIASSRKKAVCHM